MGSDPETAFLARFLTERRLARIEQVLEWRTRNLVLLLEDIYDPHNGAACMRSAEAFGLQEVHVVERESRFDASPAVTIGADKWLDLFRYATPAAGVSALKARGFVLAGAALVPETVPLPQVDFTRPTAMVLGNEHQGLSPDLLAACDILFHIPMAGFSQSFNVSVATGIVLYHAVSQRVARLGSHGDLAPEDRDRLRAAWIRKSVPDADLLVRRFRE